MNKILLATRNPGKIREIRAILASLPIELVSLLDYPDLPEVAEDGATFEANARKKSAEVFRMTGIPALSDDSGLEVYHLGMHPGVRSARYAGEEVSYAANNRKLLAAMRGVPSRRRQARFRCVVAFCDGVSEHWTEGVCTGRIITEVRGSGGFGYDPLFVPSGYRRTFAELPPEIKNRISHRAKALARMKSYLRRRWIPR